jgi:predicted house-cleaning noncanonical NTP pyrophosphatase (MazG superfamily)
MKLVRDKIPEIILNSGRSPVIIVADNDDDYKKYLKDKILEELNNSHKRKSIIEEACDVLEVLEAICKINNIQINEVFSKKAEKLERVGGFNGRFILIIDKN